MADKVLIVDDDVQTLRLVGLMLERQGFKIVAASNGMQALQMSRTEKPDVIVLDVMMPDMDGYEVTRRLRKEPDTAEIPILMFTAKAQVDDKISGYDSGADDYLTKPIHPAELTAHLRALLARRKPRSAPDRAAGYTVGVLAAKGGVGVSTLALNLAIAYHQKTRTEVIAAELRPGQGTWAVELGQNHKDGLTTLLRKPVSEITATAVENELVRMPYGVRLLMASPRAKDAELMCACEPLDTLLAHVTTLAPVVLLDVGTSYHPSLEAVLHHCNEVMVVTEPFPSCVQRTRALVEDLNGMGFGKAKLLSVISTNRVRADMQLSMIQIQESLGMPVAHVFPPAPEVAYQAASRALPIMQVQVGGTLSQQYLSLAEKLEQRIPK